MPKSPSDEDNLVAFLSGFNLLFLTFLTILIVVSLVLEGGGARGDFDPTVDYNFGIESALSKGSGHSSDLAGFMGGLGVVAAVFVMVAKNRGRDGC